MQLSSGSENDMNITAAGDLSPEIPRGWTTGPGDA